MASLTIKNVPDDLLDRLRDRAGQHRRSMQQELLALLEEAVAPERISVDQLQRRVSALGLPSAAESAAIVRRERDERAGRAGR